MKYYKHKKRMSAIDKLNNLSIVAWLIIINVIISITAFIMLSFSENYIELFALVPLNILQGKFLWTILTHMFTHGGIFHLIINMFVLFSLGGLIERIIGRKRFIWFYLISGIFAGLLSVLLAGYLGTTPLGARIFGPSDIPMVGASGAIFAIAGLYVMLLPRLKFMIIFLPFFSLPAYIMVPLILFLVWIVTVITGLPVGNVAHFGGFLAGIFYGSYLRSKYKRKIKMLQRMIR
jgi:membrane associated rhomboid family serine protease